MPELFAATDASLKAYQKRIEELEEALEPFARLAVMLMGATYIPERMVELKYGDDGAYVKVQDFRRAAELLRK